MDKRKVGKRIRTIRLNIGKNQREFADFVGCAQAAVSAWETGTALPRPQSLSVIAMLGNISVGELLEG